jgi:hypothetical protein
LAQASTSTIHIETDYELGPGLVLPQVNIYQVGIASRHARLPLIPMHRWDYVPRERPKFHINTTWRIGTRTQTLCNNCCELCRGKCLKQQTRIPTLKYPSRVCLCWRKQYRPEPTTKCTYHVHLLYSNHGALWWVTHRISLMNLMDSKEAPIWQFLKLLISTKRIKLMDSAIWKTTIKQTKP